MYFTMKRITILLPFIAMLFLGSCIKNDDILFTQSVVEMDAAAYNARAAGVTYPILTRVPAIGRATTTSAAVLSRLSGTIQLRINLVGAQRGTPTNVTYRVVPTVTTAVAGTHFAPLSGSVSIPANSSFANIDLQILNPGASALTFVDLVVELVANNDVGVSENYKSVGLRIAQ
jgi:hypothetical protein